MGTEPCLDHPANPVNLVSPVKTAILARSLPLVFLLACALVVFAPPIADPDLWGHVRFGQDALLTGQIIQADSYSYLTVGQRWINHEWLTEVLYALAYNAASATGLISLNTLLSVVIAGLIYFRLRHARMGAVGAVLLTTGASLVLRPSVLTIRPQVFTYLLFLLLLLLIDVYTENPGRPGEIRFIATIFLILALWVNLHGGVLAGAGVLYLWGLIYLVEGVSRSRSVRAIGGPPQRAVLAVLLLAPLALLLNPYGPDLPGFLLRTATVARPEILEWHGVRLTDLWSQYWLIAAVLTLVALVLTQRPRRLSLLLPLAVIALLPLTAVRHIPLFAVAAPVLAADHFADLFDRLAGMRFSWGSRGILSGVVSRRKVRSRRTPRDPQLKRERLFASFPASWPPRPAGPIVALLSFAAAVALAGLALPRLQKIVIQPSSSGFPVNAVAVLKASGVQGNLAAEFNWGEYAIWHLGPGIQVSVDGRRETVYPETIYRENLDFMRGEGQWDRLVDRPETDMALVDRERPAYNLMREKAGWVLAYEDKAAAIFLRSGSPWRAAINRVQPPEWPADGAGLAFPVE